MTPATLAFVLALNLFLGTTCFATKKALEGLPDCSVVLVGSALALCVVAPLAVIAGALVGSPPLLVPFAALEWARRAPGPAAPQCSSRFRILPVEPFGSDGRNWTRRGYL